MYNICHQYQAAARYKVKYILTPVQQPLSQARQDLDGSLRAACRAALQTRRCPAPPTHALQLHQLVVLQRALAGRGALAQAGLSRVWRFWYHEQTAFITEGRRRNCSSSTTVVYKKQRGLKYSRSDEEKPTPRAILLVLTLSKEIETHVPAARIPFCPHSALYGPPEPDVADTAAVAFVVAPLAPLAIFAAATERSM